jgi:hypothetical protein
MKIHIKVRGWYNLGQIKKHNLVKGEGVTPGNPNRAYSTGNLNIRWWNICEVVEIVPVHVQMLRTKSCNWRGELGWEIWEKKD